MTGFASRCALCLILVLSLGGCGKSRSDRAMGLIMDTDGSLLSTTDVNVRQVHQNQAAADLRDAAGQPEAALRVEVQELPVHGYDADDFPYWAYPAATLTVSVVEGFPLTDARIAELTADHFRPKLLPPARSAAERIQVQVERGAVPGPDPVASTPTTPTAADPGPADGTTTYVIQPGDTLAAISAAYYGQAQLWRLIKDANPSLGMDLEPGTRIVIPPAP